MLHYVFQEKLQILFLYQTIHCIAALSKVMPMWFDCFEESCITYTGKLEDLEECPTCKEPQYFSMLRDNDRKWCACRKFCYLPLIPRLQNFFSNKSCIDKLSYQHEYKEDPNGISNVFDADHYKKLRKHHIVVDGEKLDHKYFSGKCNIAFTICLDVYLLYKHRWGGPSVTPILVQLYNLPPDIRTHLDRLLCIGVIPGLKGPKDLHSFLVPFDKECTQLARGVRKYVCVENCIFELHVYNMFPLGNIVAIEKYLNIKGHNSFYPCWSCNIAAVNNPNGKKTYYIPLKSRKKNWDLWDLPQ